MNDDKSVSSDFSPELLLAKPSLDVDYTALRRASKARFAKTLEVLAERERVDNSVKSSTQQPHRTLKDLPVRDRLRVLNATVAENKKKQERWTKLHDAVIDAMVTVSFFLILYIAIRGYL